MCHDSFTIATIYHCNAKFFTCYDLQKCEMFDYVIHLQVLTVCFNVLYDLHRQALVTYSLF